MRIKNWNRFQHFKDRKPPWIKLYRDILDDLAFQPVVSGGLVSFHLACESGDQSVYNPMHMRPPLIEGE